jgi:hypothetical protein
MKSLSAKLGVILIGLTIFGYGNVCKAQCAWVLWNLSTLTYKDERTHDIKPLIKGEPQWEIVAAFPKYEQCVKRQEQEFLKFKEGIKKQKENNFSEDKNNWIIAGSYTTSHVMYFWGQWKCLPDTVDPRK